MLEPTAEQYRRIRRASVMLAVGSGGQNPRHPRVRSMGREAPRFDLAAFCSR
jgi:hypothetical protein